MFNYDRLERSTNIESSGVFLEHDYFKSVKKLPYKQEANDKIDGIDEVSADMSPIERAEMMMKKKQKALETPDDFYKNSYLKYKDAMEIVEKCQPFDPENPTPFFAHHLHKKVLEKLNLDNEDKLKFFTAVGSHLDHNHGVDAFFKLYSKHGEEISRATIDLTEREKRGKADMILIVSDDEQELYDPSSDKFNKEEFEKRLEAEALNIKKILEINHNKNKN